MQAVAAIVALVAGPLALWTLLHPQSILQPTPTVAETVGTCGAVEEYLAGISDEEAQLLIVYEIEDIPEY